MNTQFLTPEQAAKDGNSTNNQHIKGILVGREVNMCLSYLMDELFKASNLVSSKDVDLPNYENIENLFVYPEYINDFANFAGGTEEQRDAEIERLEAEIEARDHEDQEQDRIAIQSEIDELKELETEARDILEWWAVDSMMFDSLKKHGEPVLEYANLNLWGRTCSGQAILLDHVITVIASEMQILEGQENDWNRRGIK
jgi:hypothetical protein